jgi:hypothetical protein
MTSLQRGGNADLLRKGLLRLWLMMGLTVLAFAAWGLELSRALRVVAPALLIWTGVEVFLYWRRSRRDRGRRAPD